MSSNMAASVRARLLKVAKTQNSDFNQVLVRFALEHILYRLVQSQHADRFLLKCALLFTLWYDIPHWAMRYFVDPGLLRSLKFTVETALKRIESHRLAALVLKDLQHDPQSAISVIHQRMSSVR